MHPVTLSICSGSLGDCGASIMWTDVDTRRCIIHHYGSTLERFQECATQKKKKKKIQSYQDSFHPRLRVVRLSHFSDETHVRFRLRRLSAEPAEVLPGFFCLAPAFSSACTTSPLNVVRCVSRNSRKISRFFYCHI